MPRGLERNCISPSLANVDHGTQSRCTFSYIAVSEPVAEQAPWIALEPKFSSKTNSLKKRS